MSVTRKTITAVIAGVIFGAASIPGWAASSPTQSLAAAISPAVTAEGTWLQPAGATSRPHTTMNCRASHLYTQDDLVGDADSCIMQGAAVERAGDGFTSGFGVGLP